MALKYNVIKMTESLKCLLRTDAPSAVNCLESNTVLFNLFCYGAPLKTF